MPRTPSSRARIAVFFERRMLVMLALGFAAGLPNLLIFDTLSAWLRQVDVPLRTIGFFSLATLAYSLKFLWAPLVDRTSDPAADAGSRPSPGLDAGGAGRDHPRPVAGLGLQPGGQPGAGGVVRRAGRVRLGDPGRGDRCLAHRGRGGRASGRHGGDVPVGLPHRDPHRRDRAASPGRARRLELRLRSHGGADGDRRRGRAGSAARATTPGPAAAAAPRAACAPGRGSPRMERAARPAPGRRLRLRGGL